MKVEKIKFVNGGEVHLPIDNPNPMKSFGGVFVRTETKLELYNQVLETIVDTYSFGQMTLRDYLTNAFCKLVTGNGFLIDDDWHTLSPAIEVIDPSIVDDDEIVETDKAEKILQDLILYMVSK